MTLQEQRDQLNDLCLSQSIPIKVRENMLAIVNAAYQIKMLEQTLVDATTRRDDGIQKEIDLAVSKATEEWQEYYR